jgi:hypothetical protein
MDSDQETRLKRVEECTDELNRAVKGHNGEPGIQTNLALVQKDVATIKNNDIPHLQEGLTKEVQDIETRLKTELLLSETKIMQAITKLQESNARKYSFFSTFVWPILSAVIIAFTIYVLLPAK